MEMDPQKTISIIIPSFNQAAYLKQSIESVLSEAGDFFIELIVVDALSKDESLSIIEDFKKRVENGSYPLHCLGAVVRFLHEKDRGQADGLNKGFKMATGLVSAWIGSDDYYLPGAFAEALKAFRDDPELDFIYGNVLRLFEGTNRESTIYPLPRPDETFESLRSRGNSFGSQSTFHATKLFKKIGYFDESLTYCIDLELWMRAFKFGKTRYIPFTFAVFRIWPQSKSGSQGKKFIAERKILAKRYGGNIIPSLKIYKLRGKMTWLSQFQNTMPRTYGFFKKSFYRLVDLFKY